MPAHTPLTIGSVLAGRYRIVKPLGQGDFGVMYRAWDTRLNSPCALKENLETSPEAEQQFAQQAAQLAGLRHPNLPVMIDHFTIPGQGQYLVMDYVPGEDLRTMLEQVGGALDEARVLPWMTQVCAALSYLHSHTPPVIHRDVKPANIRITPDGNAVLVDFGISKIFDPNLKTTTGAQAVTAGFSPPELYGYGSADARSDVYALGATLYTLLTGQLPVESVQRAVGVDLPQPGLLNPRLTPQTEAAILKAMALLPADRYQNAAEFLAALPSPQAVTLHTSSLPANILTPPPAAQPPDLTSTKPMVAAAPVLPGHPPTLRQAPKRGFTVWALWSGVIALLVTGLGVGYYFVNQELQGQFTSATRIALALVTRTPTLTPTRTLRPSLTPTPVPPSATPTFTPTFSPTPTETPTPTPLPVLPLLEGASLPLGRAVIGVDNVTDLQLFARWGRGTIKEIAWSPDGAWLAAGGSIGVHVYDSSTFQVVAYIETDTGVNSLAFSPDGTLLATGMEDATIILWQTRDWSFLRKLEGHRYAVLTLSFSRDGSRLASGSTDTTIRLWSIPDGALLRTFTQPTEPVTMVRYSPDGTSLATITGDGLARLWSVSSGIHLRTMVDTGVPDRHNSVSYSPDGALLATGSDGTIEIWGTADGALLSSIRVGAASTLVTFSSNGITLASASESGGLRLGSITGAISTSSWNAHQDIVSSLAFSPDGDRLASVALDGSLRLWQVSDHTQLGEIGGHSANLTSMTMSRNGVYIASGFDRGAIHIRFATNGALGQNWVDTASQQQAIVDLDYSPNGTILASASSYFHSYTYYYGGSGRLWDPTNGTTLATLRQSGSRIAFSPNGQQLLLGSYLIDLNGRQIDELDMYTNWGQPTGIDFSPDGATLAVGYSGDELILFRTSDLERLKTLVGHTEGVTSVAFSPDGTLLASGSEDHTIRLWRVSDRILLRVLRGHAAAVTSLVFSPDGAMLVSGSADWTIRLWRVGDGAPLHTLYGHKLDVVDVAFSPDSTMIYSASLDGTLRVWGVFTSWSREP